MQLKLKELRLNRELTQAQVADAVKISAPNYSRYENGTNEPSLSMICKLADYFNTSVDYILCRSKVYDTADQIFDNTKNLIEEAKSNIEINRKHTAELEYLLIQAREEMSKVRHYQTSALDYIITESRDKIESIQNDQLRQLEETKAEINRIHREKYRELDETRAKIDSLIKKELELVKLLIINAQKEIDEIRLKKNSLME